MKDKKDDCAGGLVSSDKEVNWMVAMPCVSGLWMARLGGGLVVPLRGAELH